MSLKGKTIQMLGDTRRYTVQDVGVLSHGLRAGFVLLVQDEHGDVTQVSVTQKAISEVGFHASGGADRFAVELRRTLGLDATLASDDAVLRAVRELQDSGGRRRPLEMSPAWSEAAMGGKVIVNAAGPVNVGSAAPVEGAVTAAAIVPEFTRIGRWADHPSRMVAEVAFGKALDEKIRAAGLDSEAVRAAAQAAAESGTFIVRPLTAEEAADIKACVRRDYGADHISDKKLCELEMAIDCATADLRAPSEAALDDKTKPDRLVVDDIVRPDHVVDVDAAKRWHRAVLADAARARAARLDRQLYQAHEKIAALEVEVERQKRSPELARAVDQLTEETWNGGFAAGSESGQEQCTDDMIKVLGVEDLSWPGALRAVAELRAIVESTKADNVDLRAKLAEVLGCDSHDAAILAAVAGLGPDHPGELLKVRARLATAEANAASGQALRRRVLDAILQMGEPAKPLDDEGVIERIHSAVAGYLALEEGGALADKNVHDEIEAARAAVRAANGKLGEANAAYAELANKYAALEAREEGARQDVQETADDYRKLRDQFEEIRERLALGLGVLDPGVDPPSFDDLIAKVRSIREGTPMPAYDTLARLRAERDDARGTVEFNRRVFEEREAELRRRLGKCDDEIAAARMEKAKLEERLVGLEKAQREAAADVERLEAVWRRYAEQREQVIAKLVAVGLGQHAGADPQRAILAGIDILIANAKSAEDRATKLLEERNRLAGTTARVLELEAEIARAWAAVDSVRPKRDDLAHADAEFDALVGNRQHHGIDKAAAGLARLIREADERAQRRTEEMRALEEQADARLSGLRAVETRLRQSIRIDEETPVGSEVDEHVAWMKRAIDSLTARADRTIAERPGPRVEDLRMIQVKLVEAGAEMPAAPLFDQILAGIAALGGANERLMEEAKTRRAQLTDFKAAMVDAIGISPPGRNYEQPTIVTVAREIRGAYEKARADLGALRTNIEHVLGWTDGKVHSDMELVRGLADRVCGIVTPIAMSRESAVHLARASAFGMAGHDEDADPSEGG